MSGIDGFKKDKIVNCQLSHWYRVDRRVGVRIATVLDVDVDLLER